MADRTPPPTHGTPDRGQKRVNALDGLRAFAVVTVILYHAGVSGVSGGLLGVDVFFVLSGFLITSLLCQEFARTKSISLTRFWGRRARRLLPALFMMLLGVALYAWAFQSELDLPLIRSDAIASLLYVANWHFIISDQGYFAQSAAPSPLLHMWSLSVEEQYYLVWPLISLLVLRLRGPRALAWVAAIGAAASAALMGILYAAGSSIDRLYYGTDTRSQALLVGSLLAAASSRPGWNIAPTDAATGRSGRWAANLAAVLGAAYLVVAWHRFPGQDPFLYQGGFLLVALAAAAIVATVTLWPVSPLSSVLSLRPLVHIGRISYGLYIYHWPLFLVIDHAHTGLLGVPLLVVRLASTFVVAELSFVFVEVPIRRRDVLVGVKGAISGVTVAAATGLVLVIVCTFPRGTGNVTAVTGGLSRAERAELTSAQAFSTDPVKFFVIGDSQALTLEEGLQVDSREQFGVEVIDGAVLGCDLDPGSKILASGQIQTTSENCRGWRTIWPRNVRKDHVAVVGLLVARWEEYDHFYGGEWVHLGDPAWDRHVEGELSQAVRVLSDAGAKVVLFTAPYNDPPDEAANGTPYPENGPARVNAYNSIVRRVAASFPSRASVVDLNAMLDPGGRYEASIRGVKARSNDGVHITAGEGIALRPKILPVVAEIGLSADGKK